MGPRDDRQKTGERLGCRVVMRCLPSLRFHWGGGGITGIISKESEPSTVHVDVIPIGAP